MSEQRQTIKIDQIEYDVESLSKEAKILINNIAAVDAEISSIKTKAAIFQTARNTFSSALKTELAKV